MSAGTFFSKPSYPEREPSRPRAVNPRTGKEQSWTRASTFASALDNPYGLMKRDGRNIVMGISARPDLATMALAGALRDDVAKVDEVIATAKEVMASSAAANLGTAAHAAITRAWQFPDEPVPEPYVALVRNFAAALKTEGLTIRAAARKVMNIGLNSIGELDLVLEEADGSLVVGDMKSGNLEQAKRKFSVQLALYDGAECWINDDGSLEPIEPNALAHSHAVIIHLDLEHNAVSLYRVDLRIGRYGAGLAEQIRQWHTLDPLSPYVAPVGERKRSVAQPTVPSHHDGGPMVPPVGAVFEHEADEEDPTYVDPVDVMAENAQEIEREKATPEGRYGELMKLDKAPLQMLLKGKGWTDISHNRRWLARAIVALEMGLDGPAVKKYAAAKDDTPVGERTIPDQPGSERVTAQRAAERPDLYQSDGIPIPAERAQVDSGPSTATLLEAIAGANSMAAIRALQADVVERRGDQAWTDDLAKATQQRAIELSAQQHAEATASTLAEIKAATTKEELKNIWDRVTIGNSIPENWTTELATAGLAQLEAIRSATPPPPANPFA